MQPFPSQTCPPPPFRGLVELVIVLRPSLDVAVQAWGGKASPKYGGTMPIDTGARLAPKALFRRSLVCLPLRGLLGARPPPSRPHFPTNLPICDPRSGIGRKKDHFGQKKALLANRFSPRDVPPLPFSRRVADGDMRGWPPGSVVSSTKKRTSAPTSPPSPEPSPWRRLFYRPLSAIMCLSSCASESCISQPEMFSGPRC